METSQEIGELAAALSSAQGEFVGLIKDNQVRMELKSGRKVEYDYLDLGSIVEQVKTILSKNGLSVSQPIGTINGEPALWTILFHKSGQFIKTFVMLSYEKVDFNGKLTPMTEQEKGSVVTFNSRYNYVGILRIPLKNEDTDANDLRKDESQNKKQAPAVENKKETKIETDYNKYSMKIKTKNAAELGQSFAQLGFERVDAIAAAILKKDKSKRNSDEQEFLSLSVEYLKATGNHPPEIDQNEPIPF